MSSASIPAPQETIADSPALAELAARVARIGKGDGLHGTPLPWLAAIRATAPSQPLPGVYHPSLCLVVQGRKHAIFGGEVLVYDPLHSLVLSTSLPVTGRIVDASPARPYLCLRIDLDPRLVHELLPRLGDAAPAREPLEGGPLQLVRVDARLLDAVLRLVRLLEEPDAMAVLAPMALREIHYRLLAGAFGPRLRALCDTDSQAQRIAQAIGLLRERYAEPLRVDALASVAHMSVSALHQRFKAVTAMSPLQFQKRLRLQEARRLMLSDGLDAAQAAHRVGYESPSHFSREYRRLFGAPPRREVALAQAPPAG